MSNRTSRQASLIILASATLLWLPVATEANHSWGNYHWERESNPLSLDLGENVSSTWSGYLPSANADWNASSVLSNSVVAGDANIKNCRPPDGRIEVCSDAYGNNGWLGLAQIWVQGGHIQKGSVKVNDTYFDTPTYDTIAWRNLVMCQEVGHMFGLAHQDENFDNPNRGSCMDYTSDPSTNQHPNQHDYNQLDIIYGHADSADGGGGKGPPWERGRPARPPAMEVLELEGPGQWGELVSGSRERGAATYILDFGNGFAVVTFVTWLPE